MSEIKNVRLNLYGAEHSKCNQMMRLGFKGLMLLLVYVSIKLELLFRLLALLADLFI